MSSSLLRLWSFALSLLSLPPCLAIAVAISVVNVVTAVMPCYRRRRRNHRHCGRALSSSSSSSSCAAFAVCPCCLVVAVATHTSSSFPRSLAIIIICPSPRHPRHHLQSCRRHSHAHPLVSDWTSPRTVVAVHYHWLALSPRQAMPATVYIGVCGCSRHHTDVCGVMEVASAEHQVVIASVGNGNTYWW